MWYGDCCKINMLWCIFMRILLVIKPMNTYNSQTLWECIFFPMDAGAFNYMASCRNVNFSPPMVAYMRRWIITGFVHTLCLTQNGRHFPYDIFKCILLNENMWIFFKILLNFVHKGPINNTPALSQIMAWRQPGDKALSDPLKVSLLTHIRVTWPRWVNRVFGWHQHII